MENQTHALGTSLVRVRLGGVATTPPSEQQLVARLHMAASDVGCQAPDLVTAIYVGLKLHLRVCVCGPARAQTMALFEALALTMVGPDSEQTLHLRGPIGAHDMSQRFAALRIGDFVSTVLDPAGQGKAWFLLIDTPGDPSALLHWIEREIAVTAQAHGRSAHALPPNLFVLTAAGEWPQQAERCWLALPTPEWGEPPAAPRAPSLPPVGYQRQLLESQLTGPAYRRRLRAGAALLRQPLPARLNGLSPKMIGRWLAASVDAHQQSLWTVHDPVTQLRRSAPAAHAGGCTSDAA
jgi:hypothetical protein